MNNIIKRIGALAISFILLMPILTISTNANESIEMKGEKSFTTEKEAIDYIETLKKYNIELNQNKEDKLRYVLNVTGPSKVTKENEWVLDSTKEFTEQVFNTLDEANQAKDSYVSTEEKVYDLYIEKQNSKEMGTLSTTQHETKEDALAEVELIKQDLIQQGFDPSTFVVSDCMEQTVESIESTTEELIYSGKVENNSPSNDVPFTKDVVAQGKLPVLVIKQATYAILWTPEPINSTLFEELKTFFIKKDPSLSKLDEWYQISGYKEHDLSGYKNQFGKYTFVQTDNGVQFICPADNISHLSYGTYKTIETTSSKTLYSYEIQYALPTYVLKGNVKTYRKDTLTSYIVKWEYTSKKSTDVQTGIVSNVKFDVMLSIVSLLGMAYILKKKKK